jgi:alanine racemase
LWLFANLWADSIIELEALSITPVIGDIASLKHLLDSKRELGFHLKINTGMNRFGFSLKDIPVLLKELKGSEHLLQGFATHMLDGNSFGQKDSASHIQTQKYLEFLEKLNIPVEDKLQHLYKSAPALLNQDRMVDDSLFSWIRPGIASYGVYPENSFPKKQELFPMLQLKSVIVALQEIKQGESVSYSGTWKAPKDSLIGVCQIGYADGLPRVLSNKVNFLVQKQKLPQVGNICMDYCMIDLTKVRESVSIGDEVVVFGAQDDKIQRVEEVAELGGTIPYELLTSIAPRVQRHYIVNES